jgi:hypothetical protein
MSEVEALVHPFKVYELNDDGSTGAMVGGSYDNISAVTIACAAWSTVQGYSPSTHRKLVIYDATDTAIAFIGAYSGETVAQPVA